MKKVKAFLIRKYEFRRNTALDRTEFRIRTSTDKFLPITERDLNSFVFDCNIKDIKCSMTTVKTYLNSNLVKDVDPFQDYFDNIPMWQEGMPDYIQSLADEITMVDKSTQRVWNLFFKKWLVACVGCCLAKGTNHQVLVLVGNQGLGKSSFLNKLIPHKLNSYLYTGNVDPNNKDTLVNLAENMLINLDELENLNKTELGNLKALITQSEIKLRRAYGVFNENLRRRASFMGSVNDAEFLTDSTGNRRYLIFTCANINYEHKINMDDVYSQAYYLFETGYKSHFEPSDLPLLELLNKQYYRISTEEDMLLKYFKPAENINNCTELTPVELLAEIERIEKTSLFDRYSSQRRIGQALQKHNFRKVSRGGRKPYYVDRRDRSEDITININEDFEMQQQVEMIINRQLKPTELPEVEFHFIDGESWTNEQLRDKLRMYATSLLSKQRFNKKATVEAYCVYQLARMIEEEKDLKKDLSSNVNWLVETIAQVTSLDNSMDEKRS